MTLDHLSDTENAKSLRIEVRIKNNLLYREIFQQHKSIRHFCLKSGLSHSVVFGYLSFKNSPITRSTVRNGVLLTETWRPDFFWKESASKVASALCVAEEAVFPECFWESKDKNLYIAEAEYKQLEAEWTTAQITSHDDQGKKIIDKIGLRQGILKAMETLTPREQFVIQKRFGVGCTFGTFEEIGTELGISRGRVGQIESTALRKLRNPTRCKPLLSYLTNKPHGRKGDE